MRLHIISTLKDKLNTGKLRAMTEPLRKGSAGGKILCALISAVFLCFGIMADFIPNVPIAILLLVSAIMTVIATEIICLVIKLIFGGGKRANGYFLTAWIIIFLNNIIATQGNDILAAVLMTTGLTISVDILGRCIGWLLKLGKMEKKTGIFTYTVLFCSLTYLILYSVFFFKDDMGESRIDFYLNGQMDQMAESDMAADTRANAPTAADMAADTRAEAFSNYLNDGTREVGYLTYGPDEADVTIEPIDLSYIEKGEDFTQQVLGGFSDYSFEKTPIAGAIWYPKNEKNCPVFFMVHGAHKSATPSYLGYEYLGRYLASNGYVVISVDENIINELGSGNNIRALLLLENMKAILNESEKETSSLYGMINPDKIAIGGHSRGGEMVATAYLFNNLDVYPDNGSIRLDYHFDISGIVAIAPTVDQYMPEGHAVEIEDVDYLLIHGSNDQDVSKMMGEKQYNNVSFSEKKGSGYFKSSVYIMGANHGQFNSRWGRYDMTPGTNGFLNTANFIKEQEQQIIAKAYIRAFLDRAIGNGTEYETILIDNTAYLSSLPKTVYVTNYMDSSYDRLCDFDESIDLYRDYSEGTTVWCRGMSVWHTKKEDHGSGTDDDNHVLECAWKAGSKPSIDVKMPTVDMNSQLISFRLADMREEVADDNSKLAYKIELIDSNGKTITSDNLRYVYPTLAVQLYKQDVLFGSYEYKHQMQTVTVGIDNFEKNADFDFGSVTGISIVFDGSSDGKIFADDICIIDNSR